MPAAESPASSKVPVITIAILITLAIFGLEKIADVSASIVHRSMNGERPIAHRLDSKFRTSENLKSRADFKMFCNGASRLNGSGTLSPRSRTHGPSHGGKGSGLGDGS